MDKLLKYALDGDAVKFIERMKDKMTGHQSDAIADISREIGADMAGVAPVQESKDPMHVFVHSSGKGIKWRTSDQRTGSEPSFSDPKDEKALRAYFQSVFGKKKEFTLEIRESEIDSDDIAARELMKAKNAGLNVTIHKRLQKMLVAGKGKEVLAALKKSGH